MKEKRIKKVKEAESIIKCSIGPLGISAGCDRYDNQYWTRDFALAGKDILLQLGYKEIVKKHLLNISSRQRKSGSIPSRFAKNRKRFAKKLLKDEVLGDRDYLMHKLFVSQKYVIKRNPLNFHRWVVWYADNEILFIIAAKEYIAAVRDYELDRFLAPNINKAFNYIERNLQQNGLVVGADWRDTIYSLADKSLFSVNVMLWRAYVLCGKIQQANKLKKDIENKFWNGSYYKNTLNDNAFDTLGHSLAVLWDFIPKEKYKKILSKFDDVKTPFGYLANNMIFPKELSKYKEIERTNQFSVVWPFIHGYAILALIHMKEYDLAKEQMNTWNKIDNFYEWYNPKDGKGYGDREQMWSAALYLRVVKSIAKISG